MGILSRLFRSSAATGTVELEWKGGEVVVNPTDAQRRARNLARIETIKQALRDTPPERMPPERRRALERELAKRELLARSEEV